MLACSSIYAHVYTIDDPWTLDKNLANFGPVTPEFCRCWAGYTLGISSHQLNQFSAYPEYIIDEEPSEEDAASTDSIQLQKLNTIQCKC